MSFRKCIDDALGEGSLTEAQAKETRDLFDEIEADLKGKMSDAAATSKAGSDTFSAMQHKIAQRKRQK